MSVGFSRVAGVAWRAGSPRPRVGGERSWAVAGRTPTQRLPPPGRARRAGRRKLLGTGRQPPSRESLKAFWKAHARTHTRAFLIPPWPWRRRLSAPGRYPTVIMAPVARMPGRPPHMYTRAFLRTQQLGAPATRLFFFWVGGRPG